MHAWEVQPTLINNVKQHDVAIVLTGVLNLDKEPTDRVYFNKGVDRIYHPMVLYKKGLVKKILITGGNIKLNPKPDDLCEAELLERFLLDCGIPESDIIVEPKARNTHENAVYSKQILEAHGWKDQNVLLVTSAFHMRRAKACFDKEGINATVFSTDFYTSDATLSFFDLVPDQGTMGLSTILMHEWLGYASYKLMGYI